MAMHDLPSELLGMVFQNLADELDFKGLYRCSLVSRKLAPPALKALYGIWGYPPFDTVHPAYSQCRSFRAAKLRTDQVFILQRWINIWHSVSVSAESPGEGRTYLPYYEYIRILDLFDLGLLMQSRRDYANNVSTPSLRSVSGGVERLDATVEAFKDFEAKLIVIGTNILEKNSMIETMACFGIPSKTLIAWIEKCFKLQVLHVCPRGLMSEDVGKTIHQHCPKFDSLDIIRGTWDTLPGRPEIDTGGLLKALRPNSLTKLRVHNANNKLHFGYEITTALETQMRSLQMLILYGLTTKDSIQAMSSLSGLPALRELYLQDTTAIKWDNLNEVDQAITGFANWIRRCKGLQGLHILDFLRIDQLLCQVLINSTMHLRQLTVVGYRLSEFRGSLDVLQHHKSLDTLYIRGPGSQGSVGNDRLITSLAQLSNLTYLDLPMISKYFTAEHVLRLTPYLPRLKQLRIDGAFDDSIWEALASLLNLKVLDMYGPSSFTADAVVNFITVLGEGNRGFRLVIDSVFSKIDFPEATQDDIRGIMAAAVGGTFWVFSTQGMCSAASFYYRKALGLQVLQARLRFSRVGAHWLGY
ncbi:hypothetical protein BJX99DRAFT_171523 [Aspergillus californicus]